MNTILSERKDYFGDVSIEHGGVFINLDESDYEYGFLSAVRVMDLDSACGYTGAVLIERVTILGFDSPERVAQSLQACGVDDAVEVQEKAIVGDRTARAQVADALLSYGYYDPDYRSYSEPHSEVVQCESDGPMTFDGWTAAKRLAADEDLAEYVISQHVNW